MYNKAVLPLSDMARSRAGMCSHQTVARIHRRTQVRGGGCTTRARYLCPADDPMCLGYRAGDYGLV